MLNAAQKSKLREYAQGETKKLNLLPRSRSDVRDAVKQGIVEYVEWLDGQQGPRPDLSHGYQRCARKIYYKFFTTLSQEGSEVYRAETHTRGGTDPQVFEGKYRMPRARGVYKS